MVTDADAAHHLSRRIARLVALVFFIQLLDGTIIATSLPQIAADFRTGPVAMSVGITAYLLAMAMILPAAGWIGERYGARRVLITSISFFTLASLACGLSGRLDFFIAARVVQGAAAALMAPVGRIMVLRHAPKGELMRAIGTITWPALFAPVVGPVLGAWITETVGWQWNFYINIPLGLISIGLFLRLVPGGDQGAARPFDWLGFALSATAMLALLGGFELLVDGRGLAFALGPIASGAVLARLTVRHLRRAPDPLFDLAVCREPSFRLASITAGTLGRIAINSSPFLLPLLFQVGLDLSPIKSGQLVVVYFLGNLAMKSVTSPIMQLFGFRQVLVVNGLAAAASIGLLATVAADPPAAFLWALLFVAGATRSLQFTALNTLAFADITPAQRSTSATLSSIAQQIAMVLSVALSVAFIRGSEALRGAVVSDLVDFRAAFIGMGVICAASALGFLTLRLEAGQDVSGHSAVVSR